MRPCIPATNTLAALAVARIGVAGFCAIYLIARMGHFWKLAGFESQRWAPIGLWTHLGQPDPLLIKLALVGCVLLAIASALGWMYRWVAPLFAIVLVFVLTFRNCFGMVFHTENLMVLHAGILALAPADRRFALCPALEKPSDARLARALMLCLFAATVLSYFVAGWAKVDRVGWDWFSGQTIRRQVAFDNLRKRGLGSFYSPLGLWAVKQAPIWPPLALMTLVVELGAPLTLLDRRLALGWSLLAFCFHVGVVATMGIVFPYPLALVAYCGLVRVNASWERRLDRVFCVLRAKLGKLAVPRAQET